MLCIICSHPKTKVTNSRPHTTTVTTWRRRLCPNCGTIFTTYESAGVASNVTNRHGEQSEFSLGVLIVDITLSFGHLAPSEAARDAYALAVTIERQLATQSEGALSTEIIATVTHDVLGNFDRAAALQYAARHGMAQ